MTQDDTNQSEWSDIKNWPGGIYRNRTDSRFFVPKRRGFGVTVNFGHPKYGKISLIALLVIVLLGLLGTAVSIYLVMKFGWKK